MFVFVFADVVVGHVYVVVCVAWCNSVHDVKCGSGYVVIDEECVPYARVIECVRAA